MAILAPSEIFQSKWDNIILVSINDIVRKDKNIFVVKTKNEEFRINADLIETIMLSLYDVVYSDIKKKYRNPIKFDYNVKNFNVKTIISDINNMYRYRNKNIVI